MPYYSVGFGFAPPAFDIQTVAEIQDLVHADKLVTSIFNQLEISHCHDSIQRDGSIYRFVKTSLTADELAEKLEGLLEDCPLQLAEINEVDAENDCGYIRGNKVLVKELFQ